MQAARCGVLAAPWCCALATRPDTSPSDPLVWLQHRALAAIVALAAAQCNGHRARSRALAALRRGGLPMLRCGAADRPGGPLASLAQCVVRETASGRNTVLRETAVGQTEG